ncbi:hypothetical protein [Streptomyces sp. NPDC093111]|uniref:hypothetical protein n=1 Tax=Streptomyces sp. NPDC093111 TaxID=3154978 RepID=UPI00343BFF81
MIEHETVRTRLRAAVRATDPWTALEALGADRPDGLAEAVEELYRSDLEPGNVRRHLTWLLRILGEPGGAVLLRLLAEPSFTAADRRDLLGTAVSRGLRLPAALLHAFADAETVPQSDGDDGGGGDDGDRADGAGRGDEARTGGSVPPELVDAMGLSGDLSLAPRLGALLDDPDAPHGRVALALGRLGAREWTVPIAQRLPEANRLDHSAFAVALELMGDPAAVPHLLRWLADSGEERVFDVHHALVRLTERDPLLPERARGAAYAAAVRAAWADGRTERAPAVVGDVVVESGAWARFSVDDGAGRIQVAYDPPTPGSSWPRWDRSLTFDRKPLYRVGSICDTCELGLTLLDWPDDRAHRVAARMRERLAGLDRLDAALFDEWSPVLGELRTGHYRALLLDLPLERVTEPDRSWWHRRAADREPEDADDPAYGVPPEGSWPGVAHFQLTAPVPGGRVPSTYGALLPSQPPEALDPVTVARHTAAVAAGERPAAVALGWIDDRSPEGGGEERWLVGAVLDGHHRLTAYAAAGVPARVLLLARVDEGPGADGGLEGLAEVAAAYGCRP